MDRNLARAQELEDPLQAALAFLLDLKDASRSLAQAHQSAHQRHKEWLIAAVVGRVEEDGLWVSQRDAVAAERLPEGPEEEPSLRLGVFFVTGTRASRTAANPILASVSLMPRDSRMAEAEALLAVILASFFGSAFERRDAFLEVDGAALCFM